jgi:uncharacterized protein (DUF2384 family)
MTYTKHDVRERAIDIFGTEQKADDWMTQTSATLEAAPADLVVTNEGAEKVLHHLARIERGSSRDF